MDGEYRTITTALVPVESGLSTHDRGSYHALRGLDASQRRVVNTPRQGRGNPNVTIDGEPWFVAADVCRALTVSIRSNGGVNTHAALAKLDDSEKQALPYHEAKQIGLQLDASRRGITQANTPRGMQNCAIISESGLYKLVLRSDKPEAKTFQDWVAKVSP